MYRCSRTDSSGRTRSLIDGTAVRNASPCTRSERGRRSKPILQSAIARNANRAITETAGCSERAESYTITHCARSAFRTCHLQLGPFLQAETRPRVGFTLRHNNNPVRARRGRTRGISDRRAHPRLDRTPGVRAHQVRTLPHGGTLVDRAGTAGRRTLVSEATRSRTISLYTRAQVIDVETIDESAMLAAVDALFDAQCDLSGNQWPSWEEMYVFDTVARIPDTSVPATHDHLIIDDLDNKALNLPIPLQRRTAGVWAGRYDLGLAARSANPAPHPGVRSGGSAIFAVELLWLSAFGGGYSPPRQCHKCGRNHYEHNAGDHFVSPQGNRFGCHIRGTASTIPLQ